MAWTTGDIQSSLASIGGAEDGDKRLAFPPVPPNQAAWWQDYVWAMRQEFLRRAKQFSPTIAQVKVNATGLDVNGIGQLTITIATAAYEAFTGSSGLLTFVVGEVIYAPSGPGFPLANATKAAVVTEVDGTVTAPILSYTLIPAPGTGLFTDFVNTDLVKGATSGATCTAAAPVNLIETPGAS